MKRQSYLTNEPQHCMCDDTKTIAALPQRLLLPSLSVGPA